MVITSGATGTGSGAVAVTLTPNTQEQSRTGALTVAGQAIVAVQQGLGACTLEISPTHASFSEDPATGTIEVTVPAHCAWSATAGVDWLEVTSGSPGNGNGQIVYAVDRNREAGVRMGTIVIGGKTFTVTQDGQTSPAPECDYSVTPVQFSACMSVPYTLSATITTQAGCTWTATAGAPWITVTDGHTGSGSGVISFRLADNWEPPRNGVVMVRWPTVTAGQNLLVAQAGCYYAVSTSAITMSAAGGAGRFDVIQQSDPINCGGPTQDGCLWTAQSDVPWITITTSMPQRGDNPVNFTVAANSGSVARTGRITVRDKVVQITQPGQ